MLSKDMTTNPKAVNIIRPLNASSSPSLFSTSSLFQQQNTVSSIIRQPSNDNNPGLSFFCQQKEPVSRVPVEPVVEQHKPLVISRVNLPHRRPSSPDSIDDDDNDDDEENISNNTTGSFKPPGFGILGAGLGSFLLRGIQAKNNHLDEARVYRKIEDLEIEKNSLLTLNQTLETVVQQQSHTISDLQNRLAAIERPLTPGLDTSTSKNGIMSSADILESTDLVKYLEEEEEAFDRVRTMLLHLIEQAQTAVTEAAPTIPKRSNNNVINKKPSIDIKKNPNPRVISRRTSVGSNMNSSPSTSPIPNSRYSLQRSLSRSSSPATFHTPKYTQSSISNSSRSSRPKSIHVSTSSTKKWLN